MIATSAGRIVHMSVAHKWYDERILQKECRSLAKVGYQVTLIIPCDGGRTVDGVKLVPIRSSASICRRCTMATLPMLRKALRQDADLYHFHDPELLPTGLALKMMRKRVIYDVHEDYSQSVLSRHYLTPVLRRLIARVFGMFEVLSSRFFDHIIVVDSNIRAKFPPRKTDIVSNAPLARFVTDRLPSSGPTKIVFLGAISSEHGIPAVLEALTHLDARHIEFHLVGTIDDDDLLGALQSHSEVHLHGRLPWEQSIAVIAQADIGLLLYQPSPEHLSFTGQGNTKLFEYMAVGLPVLYSSFPNLESFIGPLGCGLPVDPTDPLAIAQAVAYLIDCPDVRREMGERGRSAVLNRFNWEIEERKLLAVYRKVLEQS